MDGEPSVFLTLETLKTLAGQVMAVGMVTQVVKASFPILSTYLLRLSCVVTAIVLHLVLVWQSGMTISAYALASLNGVLIAMSAMKAAELVKGEKELKQ